MHTQHGFLVAFTTDAFHSPVLYHCFLLVAPCTSGRPQENRSSHPAYSGMQGLLQGTELPCTVGKAGGMKIRDIRHHRSPPATAKPCASQEYPGRLLYFWGRPGRDVPTGISVCSCAAGGSQEFSGIFYKSHICPQFATISRE